MEAPLSREEAKKMVSEWRERASKETLEACNTIVRELNRQLLNDPNKRKIYTTTTWQENPYLRACVQDTMATKGHRVSFRYDHYSVYFDLT